MLRHVLNFYIDPHVKVEGKRDNVMEAKKRILEVLETKVSAIWNTINNKRFRAFRASCMVEEVAPPCF